MKGRAAVLALGVGLVLIACGDDDTPEDVCAELRADLDDLERRLDGEAEQSWDDVQDAADASSERDRLRAELADAGCISEAGG